MKYSTSIWLTIISFTIGAIPISIYFYLDAHNKMIPYLPVIVRPIVVIAFLIAVFLLLANIMASSRKEERIKKSYFQKAFVILICLIAFRLITHFL